MISKIELVQVLKLNWFKRPLGPCRVGAQADTFDSAQYRLLAPGLS